MRNRCASVWISGLLLISGVSMMGASVPQETALQAVIGFRLAGNSLIAVEGRLGQLDGLTLLIDTGTNQTVIDQSLVRRLSMASADPSGGAGRLIAPSIRFGPIHAPTVPVLTSDLHRLADDLGVRLGAIIGLDVLRGRCFVIDYVARTLTFDCPEKMGRAVSLDARSSRPLIDVTIEGEHRRMLVDTGAEAIMLFERSAPRVHVLEKSASMARSLAGSRVPLRRFHAQNITVGAHPVGPRPIFVAADPAGRVDYDGVFGVRWLSSRIMLDLERMVVGWKD